jgi:mannose-1-phosphate guanylyltransferase/mannose-6-phosphate isomerase
LSRELYPKQLLSLIGSYTMLQETVRRVEGVADVGAPIVVCNESHRFMVAEQLRELGVQPSAIVLEPVGRNTAPAVAVAALVALRESKDGLGPILLVLPADHVIRDVDSFREAVVAGRAAAEGGKLVTFGVVPDRPETGYGYIRKARRPRPGRAAPTRSKPQAQAFLDQRGEAGPFARGLGLGPRQ